MIRALIATWLAHSGVGIFAGLVAFYLTTGVIIYWACFRSAWRTTVSSFNGIVAPFFVAPATVFALMMGFLANDVWQRDRLAGQALMDERDGLVTIHELSALTNEAATRLRAAAREYIASVLGDEWPLMQHQRESPATARMLDTVMRLAADRAIAQSAGPAVQNTLIGAAVRVASARSTRLALSTSQTDQFKWAIVLMLGVFGQLGIAVVHLERRRAQVLAQVIYTSSAIVALGLIAVSEQPFHGSRQISPAPLQQLLLD